jgi:hypothetical protein
MEAAVIGPGSRASGLVGLGIVAADGNNNGG